jgi:hypothetical protein
MPPPACVVVVSVARICARQRACSGSDRKAGAPRSEKRRQTNLLLEGSGAHADRTAASPNFNIFALSHFTFCDGDRFLIFPTIESRLSDQKPFLVQKKQPIAHHIRRWTPIVGQKCG